MLTYPHFTPHFPKAMWTLSKILEHQARAIGDRPFLQWTDACPTLSFSEVNRRVNRLAHGLLRLGLEKGDPLVVFLPNSIEFVLAWFAANKIGAVEAPINTAYKGNFLEHQVNICGAKTMLAAEELLEPVLASLPRMPALERIIVWSRDGAAAGRLPRLEGVAVVAYEDVDTNDESDPKADVLPRDLAAILFTSGTTGPSKGVLIPHAQVYFFSEENVQLVGLTGEDTYATGFPLFHSNAQFLTVFPCLIAGSKCVLYEKFSATQWVDRLHATRATVVNSLGVTLPFVMAQPPTDRDRTHGLRRIWSAPTPHDMLVTFKERFGDIAFLEGFGQTEICLPFLTPHGIERPKGACGVLVDQWFDVRLVDPETDEDVPDGEVGELVVRHKEPWILNVGYAGMPEKTAESYRNLWFHTGDGMRRDAQGWYYFVDRVKDALRRRGENISSFEVEAPIREHPAVADVAVIAVPADDAGGEDEVKACIVLKEGQVLAPEALMAWCEERMPRFTIPRFVEFLPHLPKTQSEKIQKNKLRAAGVTATTWDRIRAGHRFRDEPAERRLR